MLLHLEYLFVEAFQLWEFSFSPVFSLVVNGADLDVDGFELSLEFLLFELLFFDSDVLAGDFVLDLEFGVEFDSPGGFQ